MQYLYEYLNVNRSILAKNEYEMSRFNHKNTQEMFLC